MVGTASSGAKAPYSDPSWEIWGVSSRAAYVSRADKWFEIHNLEGEPPDWADTWRNELKKFMGDIPELVMIYPEPNLAPGKIKVLPTDVLADRFGSFFMTSTFAWMMALALHEVAPPGQMAEPGTEFFICGVDMEYGTEYVSQRAGLRHFIEVAKQLGVRVTRLTGGGLVYEPVPYPMIQDDPLLTKLGLRMTDVANQLEARRESLRSIEIMQAQNKGSLSVLNQMLVEGFDRDRLVKELVRQNDDFDKTGEKLGREIIGLDAIRTEQEYWRDYVNP